MATPTIEIPDKSFFKIGEVCRLTQTQPYVLRFWESEFPTLAPQKTRAGQRLYRRADIEMVMRIKHLLYEESYTIAGARKQLEHADSGPPPSGAGRRKASPKGKAPRKQSAGKVESADTDRLAAVRKELRDLLDLLDGNSASRR
ncbi:MAG: MerR family transcriptional regulator [Acidobacteriota bacterium]